MSTNLPARASRQETLVPWALLQQVRAVVVGVGAVGRQNLLTLANMGVPNLIMFDPDTVDDVNVGPQGYRPSDIGKNKAEVTATDILALNPECKLTVEKRRFARSDYRLLEDAWVISSVDNMEGRKLIFETAVKAGAKWFGDTRTAAETIRVIHQSEPTDKSEYPKTLFEDTEAFRGSCTTKMTFYTANLSAGLLMCRFAQALRGAAPSFADDTLALLSSEFYPTES